MKTPVFPQLLVNPLVENALREDLGRAGDLTSQILIPAERKWNAVLRARQDGVIAGLDFARTAFSLIDTNTTFEPKVADGDRIRKGDTIAHISGQARALLSAERVALNFLCHLSGIATLTRAFVDAVGSHKTKICCTRKTTPGLRAIEKYAVRVGGGSNHRMGLDDAVMIKDNHIAVVGDICTAINQVRSSVGHMMKIEVEVDCIDQLRQILNAPVDVVLLDNMSVPEMIECVKMTAGRFVLEASGGVTLETVQDIAATGVDVISVGAITHSAPILDIALDDA